MIIIEEAYDKPNCQILVKKLNIFIMIIHI